MTLDHAPAGQTVLNFKHHHMPHRGERTKQMNSTTNIAAPYLTTAHNSCPFYMTGTSNEATMEAAATWLHGRLGVLLGPGTYGGKGTKTNYVPHLPAYHAWGLDNGCFTNKGAFNEAAWLTRLDDIINGEDGAWEKCCFAVAPDVFYPDKQMGDMAATIQRSLPVLPKIRALGVPAALVIQDGVLDMDLDDLPWDDFDVAFIGGSDELKLGDSRNAGRKQYTYDRFSDYQQRWARMLYRCHQEGKPIHIGRVSGHIRMAMAREVWASSCDGTYVKYRGKANGWGLDDIDTWTTEWADTVEAHKQQQAA